MLGFFKDAHYYAQMCLTLEPYFDRRAPLLDRPNRDMRAAASMARKAGMSHLEGMYLILGSIEQSPSLRVHFPDWTDGDIQAVHRRAAQLAESGLIRPTVYASVSGDMPEGLRALVGGGPQARVHG